MSFRSSHAAHAHAPSCRRVALRPASFSCCNRRTGPKGRERSWNKRTGLRRMWRVSSSRHQCGSEHSRGGTSPSCRMNPRPSRAQRGSRRLRAGKTSRMSLAQAHAVQGWQRGIARAMRPAIGGLIEPLTPIAENHKAPLKDGASRETRPSGRGSSPLMLMRAKTRTPFSGLASRRCFRVITIFKQRRNPRSSRPTPWTRGAKW